MLRIAPAVFVLFSIACEGTVGTTHFDGSPVGDSDATPSGGVVASDGTDGAALYGTYCASCHGENAEGAPAFPTSIQGYEPIESVVIDANGEHEVDLVARKIVECARVVQQQKPQDRRRVREEVEITT